MNRQDVIMKLLENGANPNIISDTGESPKSVSTNPQIVQILSNFSSGDFFKMSNLATVLSTPQSPVDDYTKSSLPPKEANISDESSNGMYLLIIFKKKK